MTDLMLSVTYYSKQAWIHGGKGGVTHQLNQCSSLGHMRGLSAPTKFATKLIPNILAGSMPDNEIPK